MISPCGILIWRTFSRFWAGVLGKAKVLWWSSSRNPFMPFPVYKRVAYYSVSNICITVSVEYRITGQRILTVAWLRHYARGYHRFFFFLFWKYSRIDISLGFCQYKYCNISREVTYIGTNSLWFGPDSIPTALVATIAHSQGTTWYA